MEKLDFVTFYCKHPEIWFVKDQNVDKMLEKEYLADFADASFNLEEIKSQCKNFAEIDKETIEHNIDNCIIFDQLGRHLIRTGFITQEEFDLLFPIVAQYAFLYVAAKNCDDQYWYNKNLHKSLLILLIIRHTRNKLKCLFVAKIANSILMSSITTEYKKIAIAFYQKTTEVLAELSFPILQEGIKNPVKNPDKILDKESASYEEHTKCIMHKYRPICTLDKKLIEEGIILSFSGGVDSTLLLNEFKPFIRACIFIDYMNRKESAMECDHIRKICGEYHIPIYIRHITELKRNHSNASYNTYREFYESATREIRFNSYKHVLVSHNCKHVLLGHNNDDVVENIIMNIRKCEKFNSLDGMSMYSSENNVSIIRPFLELTKAQIKNYAKARSLAYMQNSTPDWSMRGKIRKELNSSEIFNRDFIAGLISISNSMKTMHDHYVKMVDQIKIQETGKNEKFVYSGLEIAVEGDLIADVMFVEILFAKITSTYKLPHVTKKAIYDFCGRCKMQKRIQINSTFAVTLVGGPALPLTPWLKVYSEN